MKTIYITLLIFSFLIIFQFISGVYLFYEKFEFNVEQIADTIKNKSYIGVLEVAFPHFLAISGISFVILHLFYFFHIRIWHFFIGFAMFFSGLLDIISNFLILRFSQKFAFLKIFSFLAFEFFLFASMIILFSQVSTVISRNRHKNAVKRL